MATTYPGIYFLAQTELHTTLAQPAKQTVLTITTHNYYATPPTKFMFYKTVQ